MVVLTKYRRNVLDNAIMSKSEMQQDFYYNKKSVIMSNVIANRCIM